MNAGDTLYMYCNREIKLLKLKANYNILLTLLTIRLIVIAR